MIYEYSKDISSQKLLREISEANLPAPLRIDTIEATAYIVYSEALSSENESTLEAVVTSHVKITTVESLSIYLDQDVFPFVTSLIRNFAAENIALGITQAGKTGPVLGMFAKQFDVNEDNKPFSLKDTFDTGSLYESLKVIQYLRDNSAQYEGLSPFITDERLLVMKNKIETFLGIQLST